MVIFQLSIKLGALEKRLGKETVVMNINEWEMVSLLKALSVRNKTLYVRIMKEFIGEAKNEGFDIMLDFKKVKVKCPHCKGEVEI